MGPLGRRTLANGGVFRRTEDFVSRTSPRKRMTPREGSISPLRAGSYMYSSQTWSDDA